MEALEQDRAHNFLSPLYIKGFLKTYAQYLGLDAEKLLKEYAESQKVETPATELVLKKPRKAFVQFKPVLIFRIISVLIVSVVFVFYLRYVLKHIFQASAPLKTPKVKVEVIPVPAVSTQELVVQVRTKKECWIKIEADGKIIFQNILKKGKVEKWSAKERLELRIGKPEALEVFLNGKPVDLKKAKVKKSLIITHEGIVGK